MGSGAWDLKQWVCAVGKRFLVGDGFWLRGEGADFYVLTIFFWLKQFLRVKDRFRPALFKKSVASDDPRTDCGKRYFLRAATQNLRPLPLLKVKISISAHTFISWKLWPTVFNRIGQ